jgi:hypothetical protein
MAVEEHHTPTLAAGPVMSHGGCKTATVSSRLKAEMDQMTALSQANPATPHGVRFKYDTADERDDIVAFVANYGQVDTTIDGPGDVGYVSVRMLWGAFYVEG